LVLFFGNKLFDHPVHIHVKRYMLHLLILCTCHPNFLTNLTFHMVYLYSKLWILEVCNPLKKICKFWAIIKTTLTLLLFFQHLIYFFTSLINYGRIVEKEKEKKKVSKQILLEVMWAMHKNTSRTFRKRFNERLSIVIGLVTTCIQMIMIILYIYIYSANPHTTLPWRRRWLPVLQARQTILSALFILLSF